MMAEKKIVTFKALGWVLAYPDGNLVTAIPDILSVMRKEALVNAAHLVDVARLANQIAAGDLIDAQENYVGLFDKSRQVSLHLFEHVHGESRDRGMAMVNLREVYGAAGLFPDETELPDFLPMYLEYLSLLPVDRALAGLRDVAPILQEIHKGLVTRASDYAIPLSILLYLADVKPLADVTVPEPLDDTPEALDRAWEEHAVAFGPENDPQLGGDCGRASAMVARMTAHGAQTTVKEAQK